MIKMMVTVVLVFTVCWLPLNTLLVSIALLRAKSALWRTRRARGGEGTASWGLQNTSEEQMGTLSAKAWQFTPPAPGETDTDVSTPVGTIKLAKSQVCSLEVNATTP